MKRLLLVPTLLLIALAAPVVVAAPAHAKGATSVTIEGPGMETVTVGHFTRRTDDVDLGSLSEVAGIYGIFGSGQYTDAPDLSDAELGPRYVLTWYQASDVMAVSHVYPFAAGGAWAVVPEGQTLYGEAIQTGWWRGGTALEDAMVTLGARDPAAAADGAAATTDPASSPEVQAAAATSSPDDPAPGSVTLTTGAAAGALALVAAAGAWLIRRRRTPQPA